MRRLHRPFRGTPLTVTFSSSTVIFSASSAVSGRSGKYRIASRPSFSQPGMPRFTVSWKLPTSQKHRLNRRLTYCGSSPRSRRSGPAIIRECMAHTPSQQSYHRTRITLRLPSPWGT